MEGSKVQSTDRNLELSSQVDERGDGNAEVDLCRDIDGCQGSDVGLDLSYEVKGSGEGDIEVDVDVQLEAESDVGLKVDVDTEIQADVRADVEVQAQDLGRGLTLGECGREGRGEGSKGQAGDDGSATHVD